MGQQTSIVNDELIRLGSATGLDFEDYCEKYDLEYDEVAVFLEEGAFVRGLKYELDEYNDTLRDSSIEWWLELPN